MIKNGLNPRFSEIGKIKIGGKGETRKSKDGKVYQLPVRFEHFVVTTTERGPDGNFIINQDIMKKLGPEPKEISIRLPFDDIDMNFFTSFQYYHGKKLICHGDGEYAKRIDKNGTENKINCNPDECKFLQNTINEVNTNEKCKVSGILSCHIPASMEVGAVHRFRTHSFHSVSGMLTSLKYFKKNTNGILQGLPLKLKFIKKATPEHGNVNTVAIVLDGVEMLKMRELAFNEYKNRTELGINMKEIENTAIESGFMVDTDDPADVQDEFYNDSPVIDITEKPDPGVDAEETTEKLENEKKTDNSENKEKEEGHLL